MNNLSINKLGAVIFISSLCLISSFAQVEREVKKKTLTSNGAPEISVKFDKAFKFAGSQEFVLHDRAETEQYLFAESENKKIKRLDMLQFENFLPKIEGTNGYNEPQSVNIGRFDYFSNVETVANIEEALRGVPDSDIAKAAAFLQSKGFALMDALVYQRFVRVVNYYKRCEFIILYVEDGEYDDSEKQVRNLQQRVLKSFKIIK
jgi:hypothetical protein